MADIVFFIAAFVCILTALMIVSQKNPVYSVVYMLPFFVGMTTIFVMLSATFLAAIQMIVYGGAILVVFLFVIMLINLKPEELRDDYALGPWLYSAIISVLLFAVIYLQIARGVTPEMEKRFTSALPSTPNVPGFGSVESIAMPLFRQQMIPFELASVLIVVAILGAVLLSKKKV